MEVSCECEYDLISLIIIKKYFTSFFVFSRAWIECEYHSPVEWYKWFWCLHRDSTWCTHRPTDHQVTSGRLRCSRSGICLTFFDGSTKECVQDTYLWFYYFQKYRRKFKYKEYFSYLGPSWRGGLFKIVPVSSSRRSSWCWHFSQNL